MAQPSMRIAVGRAWLGRAALVLALAAGALWLVLGVTMAMVFARPLPQLAYDWWPYSAEARAGVAASLLQSGPTAAKLDQARRLSTDALRREPVSVAAARTLGLVAFMQGQEQESDRIFTFAESLSRRDIPTQLWLIERNVARNDIAGALRHYDRALRTSTSIREVLFPILVGAAADPSAGLPLARLVGTRPLWWSDYAEELFEKSESSRPILLTLAHLHLRPNVEEELELIGLAIRRLVDLHAFEAAHRVYLSAQPRGANATALVRDGGFEGQSRLPPFDWEYRSEPGLSGYVQQRDGGQTALFISGESGRSGHVARQLLLLRPGRYRLSAQTGDVAADGTSRPLVAIGCAGTNSTQLARIRFPATVEGGGAVSGTFAVPAGNCTAQWLTIETAASLDSLTTTPWIDSIAVRPL